MAKSQVAVVLICGIMVLVAAAPLTFAGAHQVVKGAQGPRASAVTWEFVPPDYMMWKAHIVNNGLRSLTIEVCDTTSGVPEEISHERIRFADRGAYPVGDTDSSGVIMAAGRVYTITATPFGPSGSYCDIYDTSMAPLPPVASFSKVLNGLKVYVDGSASYDPDNGTIVAYDWSFGDGSSASGVNASHSYAADGSYAITLIVRDNDGLTDTVSSVVLAVANPPVAAFLYTKDGPTVYVNASFSFGDLEIVSYVWDWGDGTTSEGLLASHTYSMPLSLSMPAEPSSANQMEYPTWYIFGHTFAPDGVTPLGGCNVSVKDTWTWAEAHTVSDADGFYSVNLTIYPSGSPFDPLSIHATKGILWGSNGSRFGMPHEGLDVSVSMLPVTITLTVTDTAGHTGTQKQGAVVDLSG